MNALLAAVSLSLALSAADRPTVVEFWHGKVPDEDVKIAAETVRMSPRLTRKEVEVTEPTRLATNVSKPTRTLHRLARESGPSQTWW